MCFDLYKDNGSLGGVSNPTDIFLEVPQATKRYAYRQDTNSPKSSCTEDLGKH